MEQHTKSGRGERVDHLLIVRAFAAFCVLTQHVTMTLLPREWPNLIRLGPINLSWAIAGCDVSGVYLFFCLSGYLMGKGFFRGRYTAREPWLFYWRRFFRIVPAYVAYLAFAFLVGGLAFNYPFSEVRAALIRLLTYTYAGYNGIPGSQFIGHLWSISTEMQFYLVMPAFAIVLAALLSKARQRYVLIAIIALLAAGCMHRYIVWIPQRFGYWHDQAYVSMFANLDLFLGGALLNFLRFDALAFSYRRQIALLFGSIAAMFLVCSYITYYSRIVSPVFNGWFTYGLPTVTAIFALSLVYLGERINSDRSEQAHSWRARLTPLAYAGSLTFSFYLWHDYFLEHAQLWITVPSIPLLTYISRVILVGGVTGFVAMLSYRYIEGPFMHLPFPPRLRALLARQGSQRLPRQQT